jgi:hypothetical protein
MDNRPWVDEGVQVSTDPRSRCSRIVLGMLGPLALACAAPAVGCDVCAIYMATEVSEGRTGFRAGVGQQFTRYLTEQVNGEPIASFGEYLNSSVTQFLLGYQVNPRFGLQLNIPFIARTFRRLENGRLERGTSIGAGDLSLVGNLLAFDRVTDRSVFLVSLLGGLELPSGNPDFLAEELDEGSAAVASRTASRGRRGVPRHSTPSGGDPDGDDGGRQTGGIHGHDLARGSGSVDGIVGGSLYWSYDRFFLTAALQYAVRREGAFSYRFANDLTWAGGPGWYPFLGHDSTLGLQLVLSGETKGKDTQAGETLDDTAITALYMGPSVRFTWGTQLSAELTGELPVVQNNTALQIVANYRIRAGVLWRF